MIKAERLNIIIPASNEAALIGACLEALLASQITGGLKAIVVANGCKDDTAKVAQGFADRFEELGWELEVIEVERGHKPSALNAGDAACGAGPRAYLDADVIVSPKLLAQICNIFAKNTPLYASGVVKIPQAHSFISRAYARIYAQVPFMNTGVPGCGLFAVNEAGRARWGDFPDIIADDTFVRLSFAPSERVGASATYFWPVVEGWGALLRVRQRQNAGVREIGEKYPELLANDDKPGFGASDTAKMALRDPIGFAVYGAIGLLARRPVSGESWSRGR